MAIFHFFKKSPVLFRCTHCYYEYELSPKQVRYLEKQNRTDQICSAKHPCHICHIGFMIMEALALRGKAGSELRQRRPRQGGAEVRAPKPLCGGGRFGFPADENSSMDALQAGVAETEQKNTL